jgi:divalent metal cation (Fe/Co/Zn/Cd) transporter
MNTSQFSSGIIALFGFLALWEMVCKGLALWKAARNGATAWYVIILIINTIGILPIIYYFFIDNNKEQK